MIRLTYSYEQLRSILKYSYILLIIKVQEKLPLGLGWEKQLWYFKILEYGTKFLKDDKANYQYYKHSQT